MIFYLYGPDTYRRNLVLHETILAGYHKKHSGLTVRHFSATEEGFYDDLVSFFNSYSLFDTTKLAIVLESEAFEKPKKFANFLNEYVEDKNKTIVVVANKKLNKEFNFLLEKPVKSQEFEFFDEAHLFAFLKKEAVRIGSAEVSEETLRLIAKTYAGDTWSAVTELSAVALGKQCEAPQSIPDFFPLIQDVKADGMLKKQLYALHHLLDRYEPPMVFNMIASLANAGAKMQMADYDVAIKSGKLDYPEALFSLILSRN